MPPHVFMLRQDEKTPIPKRVYQRKGPNFGYHGDDDAYHLVEDDGVASDLRQRTKNGTPFFRWVTAERLEAILETADDAIDVIEAGEQDDVLDLLFFAERNVYGSRTTVIDALGDRHRELVEQRQAGTDGTEQGMEVVDLGPDPVTAD